MAGFLKDSFKNRRWLFKSCFYVTITEVLVAVYFTFALWLGYVSTERYWWTVGRLTLFFFIYAYFTGILNRFAKKKATEENSHLASLL